MGVLDENQRKPLLKIFLPAHLQMNFMKVQPP
jgi:hypothetical protein